MVFAPISQTGLEKSGKCDAAAVEGCKSDHKVRKNFFFISFFLFPPCPPTPFVTSSSFFSIFRNNPGPWRQDLLASLWYPSWTCGLDTSWASLDFFFLSRCPALPLIGLELREGSRQPHFTSAPVHRALVPVGDDVGLCRRLEPERGSMLSVPVVVASCARR